MGGYPACLRGRLNRYRAILAWAFVLVVGVAVGGGGCANGGSDTATGDDSGVEGDVTTGEGGEGGIPCPSGQSRCGTACVNLVTDGKNCGKCGNACGASQVCSGAACSFSCSPPETLCGGAPEAGAPTESGAGDDGPSGEAGDDGGGLDAAGPADSGGTVGDGGPIQPYCANLGTDPDNCGACGNVCPPTTSATP